MLLFSHSNQGVRDQTNVLETREDPKNHKKKTKFGSKARRFPPRNTRDEEGAHDASNEINVHIYATCLACL